MSVAAFLLVEIGVHVLESAYPRIDFASHIIFMLFDGHGGTLISYTPQYFRVH